MNGNTPTDEIDSEQGETETLTLSVDIPVNDDLVPLWETVVEAHGDRDEAIEALETQLGSDLVNAGQIERMIFEARQNVISQRRQMAAQMADPQQAQAPESDG